MSPLERTRGDDPIRNLFLTHGTGESMDRLNMRRNQRRRFRPDCEAVEGRLLLTQIGALGSGGFLQNPAGVSLARPNSPVTPYGSSLTTASFVDPSATVVHGLHVVVGQKSYVGPYATLNATTGFIKIGTGSEVLSNALITASPDPSSPTNVFIGDKVSIGSGAVVIGPARIGAYGTAAAADTGIGANAVINGAIITPGAYVGALAYVGPGVTIPGGYYVLPGASVTSEVDLANPLKVEKTPDSVSSDFNSQIARASELADGYAYLYQGQSATGASPGTTTSGVYNGSLAPVEGISPDPGSTGTSITFEPTTQTSPKFPGPYAPAVSSQIPNFAARIVGSVTFGATVASVAQGLGKNNAILGDQGPITIKGSISTGDDVTISSPLGSTSTTLTTITGTATETTTNGVTTITITPATTSSTTTAKPVGALTIGANFQTASHAVILGGSSATYTIGSNVSVGTDAVVKDSNLGDNVTIGAASYVYDSTLKAGTVIAPGTIYIDNKVVGTIQW